MNRRELSICYGTALFWGIIELAVTPKVQKPIFAPKTSYSFVGKSFRLKLTLTSCQNFPPAVIAVVLIAPALELQRNPSRMDQN